MGMGLYTMPTLLVSFGKLSPIGGRLGGVSRGVRAFLVGAAFLLCTSGCAADARCVCGVDEGVFSVGCG